MCRHPPYRSGQKSNDGYGRKGCVWWRGVCGCWESVDAAGVERVISGPGQSRRLWEQGPFQSSQPVVHEFDQITVPTVLMIGQKDSTAIGKDRAPPELAKALGNYPELGGSAHQRIRGSTLVTFPELGHSPQVQDPVQFNKALLKELSSLK